MAPAFQGAFDLGVTSSVPDRIESLKALAEWARREAVLLVTFHALLYGVSRIHNRGKQGRLPLGNFFTPSRNVRCMHG